MTAAGEKGYCEVWQVDGTRTGPDRTTERLFLAMSGAKWLERAATLCEHCERLLDVFLKRH